MGKEFIFSIPQVMRYTPPVNILAIQSGYTDSQTGTAATEHNLINVPAGALLVLLTGNQNSNGTASVSDSEGLTWTKRSDNHQPGSPNSEIWTAVFAAGGDIDVTSDWGATRQASSIYVVTGQEDTLSGASANSGVNGQATPNVNITTTRANSLVFVNSTNWNAVTGARTYRGTAIETFYSPHAESTFFHYTYATPSIQLYTVGMTAPNDGDAGYGTSVLEIRGSGTFVPDTTPPSAPVLSSPSHGATSVSLSWTASTDNVSVAGYRIFRDGVLIHTTTSLSYNNTGLSNSTAYDYIVQAFDPSNNTTDSNEITVTTNAGGGGGGIDHADFSFTPIVGDYERHLAGNYRWNEKSGSQIVPDVPEPQDDYRRFTWTDIEHTTQNNYVWTKFDDKVKDAINAGHTFSFGIMTSFPGNDGVFNRREFYGGTDERTDTSVTAYSAYPEYLHDLMQSEGTKDWKGTSNDWVPNYNSSYYKIRLEALHEAIKAHINSTSHVAVGGPHDGETIQFADVIEFVDVRGVGSYGEWHHNASIPGWPTEANDYFPAGTFPTIQSFKDIIDAHVDVFTDWMLVIIFNVLDHELFVNTQVPNEVAVYALTVENNWGPLGLRDDHIGDYMSYNDSIMKDNNEIFDSAPNPDILINDVVGERWKLAPLMGEPPGYISTGSCGTDMCSLGEQLDNYHYAFVGNGNFGGDNPSGATEALMQGFYEQMGHVVRMTGGSMDLDAVDFSISIDWENFGNAPAYNSWDVTFELRDQGDSSVVWTDVSQFDPFRFLPDDPQTILDIYDRPSVADGTYDLYIILKDPKNNYRRPFFLGVEGRESDGAYFLCEVTFAP